jgi:hypothetical protein
MGLFGARPHPLVGTWRLISAEFELADGDKAGDVFGPEPRGWLIVTADGRLMAMLGATESSDLMTYTGAYRLEGEGRFVTRVDMAWRADWVGTDQGRNFRIEGDELFIVSDELPHPVLADQMGRGVLRWRRHRQR